MATFLILLFSMYCWIFGIFHGSWSTQGNSSSLDHFFSFPCFVIHFFPFIFWGFTMDQKGYNVSLDLYLLPGNHHVSFTFQHSGHVPLYKIWLISVLLLNWCMVLNKMSPCSVMKNRWAITSLALWIQYKIKLTHFWQLHHICFYGN